MEYMVSPNIFSNNENYSTSMDWKFYYPAFHSCS